MRVFVTGATGFVGRALIPRLQRDGHAVVAWVRSPARARGLLGAEVELVHADTAPDGLVGAIERSDAVVNLAGEPLMGGRWTAARRAVLEGSRIAVTEQLVRAMAEAKSRPRVFISGSAVGYYGDRTDELLTEASSTADDFLARPCRRWECAAQEADRLGARVVLLRTGVVLGRAGGALAQVLPPFQLGVGGPVGWGKQYLPWVHLHNLVKIYAAFGRGDIPAILDTLADNVTWEAWADNSAAKVGVPWLVPRHGKAGASEFFGLVGPTLVVKDFRVLSLMDGGDQVAVECEIECDVPSTGGHYRDERDASVDVRRRRQGDPPAPLHGHGEAHSRGRSALEARGCGSDCGVAPGIDVSGATRTG